MTYLDYELLVSWGRCLSLRTFLFRAVPICRVPCLFLIGLRFVWTWGFARALFPVRGADRDTPDWARPWFDRRDHPGQGALSVASRFWLFYSGSIWAVREQFRYRRGSGTLSVLHFPLPRSPLYWICSVRVEFVFPGHFRAADSFSGKNPIPVPICVCVGKEVPKCPPKCLSSNNFLSPFFDEFFLRFSRRK